MAVLDTPLSAIKAGLLKTYGKLALPHDLLAVVVATPNPVLSLAIDLGEANRNLEVPAQSGVDDSVEEGFTWVRACAALDAHQIADFELMLRHRGQVAPDRAAERPDRLAAA